MYILYELEVLSYLHASAEDEFSRLCRRTCDMCHSVDIKVLRPSARAAAAIVPWRSNFKQLKRQCLVERTMQSSARSCPFRQKICQLKSRLECK
mgnify:FL=1